MAPSVSGRRAISDSSPLIFLASIGQLEVLRGIFTEIFIPEAVWDEVVRAGGDRVGAIEVGNSQWLRRVAVSQSSVTDTLLAELGRGESESIALAIELGHSSVVLLDDQKARRLARRYSLSVLGTDGVLLLAKERRIISHVKPMLEALRANGLYVSDAVANELLMAAGEFESKGGQ